jgi:LPS sulfotransferase NodH
MEAAVKNAYLVTGPPSSGTRLMTRILIAAGCEGCGDHYQRFDDILPTAERVVVRRHYPTERPPKWAKDDNIITALQAKDYTVRVVIINRDWPCTIQSMLNAPHAGDEDEAYQWLRRSWRMIFEHMPADVDFHIVSYEGLAQRPKETTATLLSQLGLNPQCEIEAIVDGNAKYHE